MSGRPSLWELTAEGNETNSPLLAGANIRTHIKTEKATLISERGLYLCGRDRIPCARRKQEIFAL
jgi:hypothetical protein